MRNAMFGLFVVVFAPVGGGGERGKVARGAFAAPLSSLPEGIGSEANEVSQR